MALKTEKGIFNETLGHFTIEFVATKPGITSFYTDELGETNNANVNSDACLVLSKCDVTLSVPLQKERPGCKVCLFVSPLSEASTVH